MGAPMRGTDHQNRGLEPWFLRQCQYQRLPNNTDRSPGFPEVEVVAPSCNSRAKGVPTTR